MFRYTVTPDPHAHLLRVSLELTPPQDAVTLHMPSWTSGSYLIRDYAGRIRGPRSNTGTLVQTDKCHWTVSGLTPGATLRIEWEAFTYSVGIHDAWLDDIRGFYNPAAVLLIPEGIDAPCLLDFSDCRFVPHCSLEPIGTHSFAASCTQELLDAPVTFTSAKGEHCILNLSVCGIPHTLVFTGPGSSTLNKDLILQDAQAILKTVLDFWGAAPFRQYLFHIQIGPRLYGGLEHEASCVLQTDTLALPGTSESSRPKDYEDFLTVFAHEYFHAWLVKHLRPASFLPYKLERECHTHDLWVFEGFTTYYENVLPFRAGVLDEDKLLSLTSARFNRVREREGFHVESLSDASFNAWTHLYKQTPDSAYCQASYYGKGAVLAFMLDAALRKAGFSLDEVLKTWFHEALADPQARSLPDGGFFERIPVASIAERFKKLVTSSDRTLWENEWRCALSTLGMSEEADKNTPASRMHLGLQLDGLRVSYAESRGSAYAAGLFAGDEIIAVNGLRADAATIERMIAQAKGSTVHIHYFREHLLRSAEIEIPVNPLPQPGTLKMKNPTEFGRAWIRSSNRQA